MDKTKFDVASYAKIVISCNNVNSKPEAIMLERHCVSLRGCHIVKRDSLSVTLANKKIKSGKTLEVIFTTPGNWNFDYVPEDDIDTDVVYILIGEGVHYGFIRYSCICSGVLGTIDTYNTDIRTVIDKYDIGITVCKYYHLSEDKYQGIILTNELFGINFPLINNYTSFVEADKEIYPDALTIGAGLMIDLTLGHFSSLDTMSLNGGKINELLRNGRMIQSYLNDEFNGNSRVVNICALYDRINEFSLYDYSLFFKLIDAFGNEDLTYVFRIEPDEDGESTQVTALIKLDRSSDWGTVINTVGKEDLENLLNIKPDIRLDQVFRC